MSDGQSVQLDVPSDVNRTRAGFEVTQDVRDFRFVLKTPFPKTPGEEPTTDDRQLGVFLRGISISYY